VKRGRPMRDEEPPSNTRKSNGSVDKPGILRRLARERPALVSQMPADRGMPSAENPSNTRNSNGSVADARRSGHAFRRACREHQSRLALNYVTNYTDHGLRN
jgi:hypothetical protein